MRPKKREWPSPRNLERLLRALRSGLSRTDAARVAGIDRRYLARRTEEDLQLRLTLEAAEEDGRKRRRMRSRLSEITGRALPPLTVKSEGARHKRGYGDVLTDPWSGAGLIILLTLVVHGVRLGVAPDFLADEGAYLTVAQHVAQGRGLTELNGSGFFWHPPLFVLLEAGVLKILGLEAADPVRALAAVRWTNVGISALTAGMLFLFVRRLSGSGASWTVAALFILDPYIQRINRRNMLESLAVMLLVAALFLAYTHRDRLSPRRKVAAGIAFGLAILTKEIAAVMLLGLLLHAVWYRRSQLAGAVQIVMVATATYLVYPLWAAQSGQFDRYLDYRFGGLARYLNFGSAPSIPGLDVGGGGSSTTQTLAVLLPQYTMTYLLLGLGAISTAILVIVYRNRPDARYVAGWAIAAYVAIGFGVTLGQISDQFFYFLIVPAIVAVSIVISDALRTVDIPARLTTRASLVSRAATLSLLCVLLILPFYNANEWVHRYVGGMDDGYTQITQYVQNNLAPGTQIMVGGDVANYLLADYQITFQRDTQSIVDTEVRYFILSSKDAWAGYHGMSQPLYDWIRDRTRPLVTFEGTTFWHIGLYELMDSGTAAR